MYQIYGLKEKDSNTYKYVGKTINTTNREYMHRSIRTYSPALNSKDFWIWLCKKEKIEIELVEIDNALTEEVADFKEQYHIQHLQKLGHKLLNHNFNSRHYIHLEKEKIEEIYDMAEKTFQISRDYIEEYRAHRKEKKHIASVKLTKRQKDFLVEYASKMPRKKDKSMSAVIAKLLEDARQQDFCDVELEDDAKDTITSSVYLTADILDWITDYHGHKRRSVLIRHLVDRLIETQ